LNDQERIEFYSRLSNRFKENLKVLQNTNEKREKSLTVAHNAVNIASENVNRLNFHNLRAKLLLTFSALLFCLCISAQNFRSFDYRGKTKIEIAQTFGKIEKCWVSNPGADYYRSDEIKILFNYSDKGKCNKIVIKTLVGNPITFDKNVIYTAIADKFTITYTIEKTN
jgi:hypothetical protein